jgi:hypothetical protein
MGSVDGVGGWSSSFAPKNVASDGKAQPADLTPVRARSPSLPSLLRAECGQGGLFPVRYRLRRQ